MRIDPKVSTPPVTTETRETQARPTGKPAVSAASSEASVVQLSAAGTAAAEPKKNDITTRLQTIKAMIDAGDYPVDLNKLAERIVDDEFLREAAPGRAS